MFATGLPRADHHARCRVAFHRLLDARIPLLTTEVILAETHALALSRSGTDRAIRLLRGIAAGPAVEVVAVDAALRRAGVDFLASRPGRSYSLADAISFVVMRERGMTQAFTLDADFVAEGFEVLPSLL